MSIEELETSIACLEVDPATTAEGLETMFRRCLRHTKVSQKARKKKYNASKRLCVCCGIKIRRDGWNDHLTTRSHKKVLRKIKRAEKAAKKAMKPAPKKKLARKAKEVKLVPSRPRSGPSLGPKPKPKAPKVKGRSRRMNK